MEVESYSAMPLPLSSPNFWFDTLSLPSTFPELHADDITGKYVSVPSRAPWKYTQPAKNTTVGNCTNPYSVSTYINPFAVWDGSPTPSSSRSSPEPHFSTPSIYGALPYLSPISSPLPDTVNFAFTHLKPTILNSTFINSRQKPVGSVYTDSLRVFTLLKDNERRNMAMVE
ncbi:hypothetical protein JAAARDRAFT_197476 [Jaapia argillacea MUCL 33604]|uniref:Uncharacterized protein n=1 Tax=Jaapia argillacea MUCL 33604 TaxID=933084 RepID=A0A067PHI3_9AGAM|nr:hypothetical protein JAAARDRAFT_197476 [Jaapia argillacea MUCL 33604]